MERQSVSKCKPENSKSFSNTNINGSPSITPKGKNNEIEISLYRYGFAYHPSLYDRIYVWKTKPVFKTKRK